MQVDSWSSSHLTVVPNSRHLRNGTCTLSLSLSTKTHNTHLYYTPTRPSLTAIKKSFKEMVRAVDANTLLDNIKLLKRTVTSSQDLLDVVNTPSTNDMKTVLHKQVRDVNVIKVAVLVQLLPCLDIGARDVKGQTAIDYATNQEEKAMRTYLLEVYKFRVRRSRGEKKASISRSKLALQRMIQQDFVRNDKLRKLRHIIRKSPPSRVRAELRSLECSLCEVCDLSAVIDIVKAGKKNARTALQKALDRTLSLLMLRTSLSLYLLLFLPPPSHPHQHICF